MFNLMKPGHVLLFATDPATIISPPSAASSERNDNTRATAWPAASHLGLVQCVSHPAGGLGAVAADVATRLRAGPTSNSRSASYSAIGRALTASNRAIGSEVCDFVGYVDGQSNYVQSTRSVFSKDFSGCLMVVYSHNGQRHVAHAAASAVARMDCKQAFLNTLRGMNAVLTGWFRPFVGANDSARKATALGVIGKYIGHNINNLTTFGVVTQAGLAYSIDAFKPTTVPGNSAWVVTDVRAHNLSQSWNVG